MNNGTFPNEERKEWTETCPKCGEEFVKHKGGPQCQIGKCSDLALQNEHEEILSLMIAVALPQYRVDVEAPKDWHFGVGIGNNLGLSNAFSFPPWLKIPWYTCRIKKAFFDTTCHEAGHISAIHAKTEKGHVWFSSSSRQAIRKWMPWAEKWVMEQQKFKKDYSIYHKVKKIEKNPKYKSKIDYFWQEWDRVKKGYSERGHEETAWHSEYKRIHGLLMTTSYAKYNYYNLSPLVYDKARFWSGF